MTERYINPFTDFGFKLLDIAEVDKLNKREQQAYRDSVKIYRDWKNVMDTAFETGFEDGQKKKATEVAQNLKQAGVAIPLIAQSTGLTEAEIEKL